MVKRENDLPLFADQIPAYLTVSELAQSIKNSLEREPGEVWIVGEISNFRIPPSGHLYFTLKDDKAQIAAGMFRRQGNGLAFAAEDGMEVLCFGRVSLYAARGDVQLYVEIMEPRGKGALYLAFVQLKQRLAGEGLYAAGGDLQLCCEIMEPRGKGALYLAFVQLKPRLAVEGLFAAERKRPLPL